MEDAKQPAENNQQEVGSNRGQAINKMIGGIAIGQLTVYFSQNSTEPAATKTDANELGANPYRGLLAFQETDGDRFFGREAEVEELWQKFSELHAGESKVRLLPIYGPSGSGKSSLARAGLIPALGKRNLPGRDRARLAVMVPGTHPLEALAAVLARIATNDATPVAKSQEFEQVLKTKSDEGKYEGLRRIADVLPDIDSSPLIILVDQFEEVYTYALSGDREQREAFIAERNALIENLLNAAAERSPRVSVILTMRSDFLGDTQQHPLLNKLFSTQGFLVPIMQPEELETAITKPAAQAGYKLDAAVVKLLVEQTQGQSGALPLLQFALTRIWEGLRQGVDPLETLENIGGVGGALAGEAQRLYGSLTPEDQAIARSMFLALVQLNEHSGDTRRRVAVSELIASEGDKNRVWSVINRFADPRVRFLVTFADKQQGETIEMIEVAHEALIHNWKQLQDWLKECREALRKKRKIEQAAEEWRYQSRAKDYLLQGRSLRDAKEFMQAASKETALSSLAAEFIKASVNKQRINILKLASLFLIFPLIGTALSIHLQIISRANSILSRDDCKPDSNIKEMLQYMWWTGSAKGFRKIKLCNEDLRGIELPGIEIVSPDFKQSNLSNAKLYDAKLPDANFKDTNLAYANLSNAVLAIADFQPIKNQCSDLVGANFQKAKLMGAKLQNTCLKDADFRGADLTDANLADAKDLKIEKLENATLCRTVMPVYLADYENRNCPKD